METNNHIIQYKKQTVEILQYLSESNTRFKKRMEYINKLENEDIEWKEAVRLSRIWYCIKYLKCKYIQEVYHRVMNLAK